MSYQRINPARLRLHRGERILPYLVKRAYQERDKINSDEEEMERLKMLQKFVTEDMAFIKKETLQPDFRQWFHPSSAMSCLRRTWFRMLKAETDTRALAEEMAKRARCLHNGQMTHYRWAIQFARYGILRGRELPWVDEKNKMRGKADGVVQPGDVPVLYDIKGFKDHTYTEAIRTNYPGDGAVYQLQEYMYQLGIKTGCIIMENKDTQDAAEFSYEFDLNCHLKIVDRKNILFDCVERLVPPDRESDSPLRFPCTYCDFAGACWSSAPMKMFLLAQERKRNGETKIKAPGEQTGPVRECGSEPGDRNKPDVPRRWFERKPTRTERSVFTARCDEDVNGGPSPAPQRNRGLAVFSSLSVGKSKSGVFAQKR